MNAKPKHSSVEIRPTMVFRFNVSSLLKIRDEKRDRSGDKEPLKPCQEIHMILGGVKRMNSVNRTTACWILRLCVN